MAKISPSIHEAFIEQCRAKDAPPDAELDAMHDAVRACRLAAEQATSATERIMASPMNTAAANATRARSTGFELAFSATKMIDAARDRATATIERLERATCSPPEPVDARMQLLHGEIRSALLRMTDEARQKAVSDAITAGDDVTVAAVLHGPQMLTGIGSAARELFRDRWRRSKFPAELDRVERLRKATIAADRAARLLIHHVDGLTDSTAVRLAEAAEKLAADAITLARPGWAMPESFVKMR